MLLLKKYKKLIFNSIAVLLFVISIILEHGFHYKRESILLSILYIASICFVWEHILYKLIKSIKAKSFFNEYLMMSIAIIAAIALKEYLEAFMVLIFYNIGTALQKFAINKAEEKISNFVERKETTYDVYQGDVLIKKLSNEITRGDVISIAPGEIIPVDSKIIKGNGLIDTSSYTGEEIPVEVGQGDMVIAGTVNLNSHLILEATADLANSKITEINDIINMAVGKKSNKEKFVNQFAKYYTPTILLIVICMVVSSYFAGGNELFKVWLKKSLLFLVASCPCALVISVPLAYFAGIGKAATQNIVFKGANYLEMLANMKVFVFDKTGTLTKRDIEITEVNNIEIAKEIFCEYLASAEITSHHPIAESIKKKYGDLVDFSEIEDMVEDGGMGVQLKYKNHKIKVGKAEYIGIDKVDNFSRVYMTVDGIYVGNIKLGSIVKKGSKSVINYLQQNNKETLLLTGDAEEPAKNLCKELGIIQYEANLKPVDKVARIEKEQKAKKQVAYIGDGINDGPALASADIGIAIGGRYNSSAIKVGDIVLLSEEIEKLIKAIKISKKTKKIAYENICVSLLVKFSVLIAAIFWDLNMAIAVFADVGITLLAVFNALRVTRIK